MQRVMVFGSFDPLHEGHRSLFRQARRQGDFLIVVVARNSSIERMKGHKPRFDEEERRSALDREELVDEAVLGNEVEDAKDFLKIVVEKDPDILVLGYDQVVEEEELQQQLAKHGRKPTIKRAVAFKPEKYKSSKVV